MFGISDTMPGVITDRGYYINVPQKDSVFWRLFWVPEDFLTFADIDRYIKVNKGHKYLAYRIYHDNHTISIWMQEQVRKIIEVDNNVR